MIAERKERKREGAVWVLGNTGHCSTDMSSLGSEESSKKAKVLPLLAKEEMDKAGSCQLSEGAPKPEIPVFPEEAVVVADGPQSIWPSAIQSPILLPNPSHSPALSLHSLPLLLQIISICPEAIDCSHSISIDLSSSLFLFFHQ